VSEIDPPSPDSIDELDLTPRVRDEQKRGSRKGPLAVLAVITLFVGFLLFQGLSGATLFLREADSAVENREELGDRRFRLLGSPISITEERFEVAGETAVRFSIACDGVAVDIIHLGNVAESFQMGVPVALEGRWASSSELDSVSRWDGGANDGFYFESDRMLVKHDNEYRTDRVDEAAACGSSAIDAPTG